MAGYVAEAERQRRPGRRLQDNYAEIDNRANYPGVPDGDAEWVRWWWLRRGCGGSELSARTSSLACVISIFAVTPVQNSDELARTSLRRMIYDETLDDLELLLK